MDRTRLEVHNTHEQQIGTGAQDLWPKMEELLNTGVRIEETILNGGDASQTPFSH